MVCPPCYLLKQGLTPRHCQAGRVEAVGAVCSSLPLHRSKPLCCSGICPLPFPQTAFGSAVHTIPEIAVKSSGSDSERKQKEGEKVLG